MPFKDQESGIESREGGGVADAVKVSSQCPLVLLVKVRWRRDGVLGLPNGGANLNIWAKFCVFKAAK